MKLVALRDEEVQIFNAVIKFLCVGFSFSLATSRKIDNTFFFLCLFIIYLFYFWKLTFLKIN